MSRVFVADGREFPDPDPTLSIDEVHQAMADFLPELATAEVRTTQRGEDTIHEFVRRVGTKGGAKQAWHDMVVTVQCDRCQALLYRKVFQRYQTKGERWGLGIRIASDEPEPHSCPNPDILSEK